MAPKRDPARYQQAVEAVTSGRLGVKAASREFNIPKATLRDKLHKGRAEGLFIFQFHNFVFMLYTITVQQNKYFRRITMLGAVQI